MPDAYRVEWAPSGKREFVYGGLADNPHGVGRELHLGLAGLPAARRGDFRVVHRIDDTRRVVVVTTIDHRAAVYRRR
jgi:mRNA-degrading endonuclease RelE of RelBE toxin-antitoxin system